MDNYILSCELLVDVELSSLAGVVLSEIGEEFVLALLSRFELLNGMFVDLRS